MTESKFLKESDLAKIRMDSDEVQKLKLQLRNLGLQIENLNLKIGVLEKTKEVHQLNLAQLSVEHETLKQKARERADEHADFAKKIAQDYQVEGKWGFNPDTGEILTNN